MTLVQSEPKKIYIRVDVQPWQPWANTTMYFKFNWNLKDEISWTTYTASAITYWTLSWWQQYAILPWNNNSSFAINNNLSDGWSELTMHTWFYVANTNNMRCEFATNNYYTSFIWEGGNIGIYYYDRSQDIWNWWASNIPSYNINERHLFSQTIKADWKIKIFLDGQLWWEKNMQSSLWSSSGSQYIWAYREWGQKFFVWWLSEMIAEKIEWTEQEVADYYNLTKWNYWL